MKIFAAILFPLAFAAASDQQGKRRLIFRKSEDPKKTGTATVNGAPILSTCPNGTKYQKEEDDLGYRFNKFAWSDGSNITLDWNDYPLNDTLGYKLRNESNAISVMTKYDFEVKRVCISKYIQGVGGYPTFPSNDPNSTFWPDLEEVVQAQIDRRNGTLPDNSTFTLPDLWQGWDVSQVGEAVHDEILGTYHADLLKSFGKGLQMDPTIFPFRSKYDFIGSVVRTNTLNSWSIGCVAPVNFYAKWEVGRQRPEDVAWLIASRKITNGVPASLVDLIDSMNLTNATSFTQYPEGSPRHPSWPAMHSAASSASLWLAVVANLTEAQYCQVLRTDFAVAYARTISGVHYHSDNIAGLNMGQMVVSRKLARHLALTYGSDREVVKAKIRKMRFDWNTFDPETCTVQPKYK